MKTIISLFDYSGSWSAPYREAGHNVIQVDIKLGIDIMTVNPAQFGRVDGILAAPPCTDFAVSGAQWWPVKDTDGRTAHSIALVRKTLDIIQYCQPDWWALENPVGRIDKLVPELQQFGPWWFQPHWYGDPYTKKTGLWGTFNRNLPTNYVEPEFYERGGKRGSWMWATLGGKSERTKEMRSITPAGFAQAFYKANNWQDTTATDTVFYWQAELF